MIKIKGNSIIFGGCWAYKSGLRIFVRTLEVPFFCTQKCALSPTDQLVMETPLESRFWNNIPRGILFTEGSKWSAQRKFSPKTLKDFNFEHQRVNPFWSGRDYWEFLHNRRRRHPPRFRIQHSDQKHLLADGRQPETVTNQWKGETADWKSNNTIFKTVFSECMRKRTRMGQRADSIRNVPCVPILSE